MVIPVIVSDAVMEWVGVVIVVALGLLLERVWRRWTAARLMKQLFEERIGPGPLRPINRETQSWWKTE